MYALAVSAAIRVILTKISNSSGSAVQWNGGVNEAKSVNFISCGSTLFSKLSNPGSLYKCVTCYFVCWESLKGYFWRTARTRMKCCMVRNNIRVCAVCQDKDNIQVGLLMEISICYPSNKKNGQSLPYCITVQ